MVKTTKGGAIIMPGEYYGLNSGRYTTNTSAGLEQHAYGKPVAVSYGVTNGSSTGPNLAPFPNSSGTQTGGGCGRKHKKKSLNNKNKKKSLKNKNKNNNKKKSLKNRRK